MNGNGSSVSEGPSGVARIRGPLGPGASMEDLKRTWKNGVTTVAVGTENASHQPQDEQAVQAQGPKIDLGRAFADLESADIGNLLGQLGDAGPLHINPNAKVGSSTQAASHQELKPINAGTVPDNGSLDVPQRASRSVLSDGSTAGDVKAGLNILREGLIGAVHEEAQKKRAELVAEITMLQENGADNARLERLKDEYLGEVGAPFLKDYNVTTEGFLLHIPANLSSDEARIQLENHLNKLHAAAQHEGLSDIGAFYELDDEIAGRLNSVFYGGEQAIVLVHSSRTVTGRSFGAGPAKPQEIKTVEVSDLAPKDLGSGWIMNVRNVNGRPIVVFNH